MNIYKVRDNLKRTIEGKESLLIEWRHSEFSDLRAVSAYLEVNINELKKILVDVEVCCEQYNEMSWTINPERMGR